MAKLYFAHTDAVHYINEGGDKEPTSFWSQLAWPRDGGGAAWIDEHVK